ncbi:MAG TPA: TetR/AcrR family transcriptional regulator [Pseudomonadales bacterium]|nr:TetR/AcrR family transcriptional regulator [Pseudomonadales bacterium]
MLRSEAAIRAALLARLAAGQSFAELTVSGVAAQAGVTRKTFYARYGSLEQVVERTVERVFSDIAERIEDRLLVLPLADDALSTTLFRAYEAHQAVLAPLIRQCPTNLFIGPVRTVAGTVLQRAYAINGIAPIGEVEEAYLVATMASVVHAVLSVWIDRGFTETPEQVAGFVHGLLADGLQRLVMAT